MASSSCCTAVSICIATYMRPAGLSRLLASLCDLEFRRCDNLDLRIVVIDNDSRGSARPVVEAFARRVKRPVVYCVEPRRGIPFARNRAVSLSAGSDLVAFIDDDEIADVAWLDNLLLALRTLQADLVEGPVIPVFESRPPRWILDGRFFERPRRKTGTALKTASTSNVLVKRCVLDGIHGPFDERLALHGGTDTLLSMQLIRRGARATWCHEAIVQEVIPPSRVTRRWILQRAFREGNGQSLVELFLEPTIHRRCIRFGKACARIVQGLLELPASLIGGQGQFMRSCCRIALGTGMVAGVVGYMYEEYRQVHGR